MTASRIPLSASILAQEERVRQADGRLRATVAQAQARFRGSGRGGTSPLLRLAPLIGGWLLMQRRRRVLPAPGAQRRGRVAVLLDFALPALAPFIGVRVASVLGALAAAGEPAADNAPDVVPRVDLDLYAGTWYEIARLPERHEGKCAGDVTATYLPRGRGLAVVNRCRRADGRHETVVGAARVVDTHSRAKLEVTFAPRLLRWLPWVWADYWILDVSPDYTRALVGSPDRRHLWMLAREPSIGAAEYRALRLIAAAKGYDTMRVRLTTSGSVRPGP